jgi:hypothetical protein
MNAKVGDRISLDAKKVGQARRTGNVRALIEGLSGVRYEVQWDDGSVSVISPGGGVLLVEGKAKRAKAAGTKSAARKKDNKKAAGGRTKGR